MYRGLKVRLAMVAVLAAVTGLGACRENPLAVSNPNNPDVARVFGTPRDVETIISKLMQQEWNGNQGATGNVGVQMSVMSLENHSTLANFGMGARGAIPRGTIANNLGNASQTENFRDFDFFTRNARSAANAIAAMQKFVASGVSTGTATRDRRAISVGYYNLGYALGYLALMYDSAAIITPAVPSDVIPALSAAKAVNAVALQMLDSAEKYSTNMDAVPTLWVSGGGTDVQPARWVQIIRSHRARFRANVARTPAERAAVDWNAVIADATSGITSDFVIFADATNGWGSGWRNQFAVDATWSQMTPMLLGMGDTTRTGDPQGSYEDWIKLPLDSRAPFLMRTPDKRWPSGETRPIQTANSAGRGGTPAGTILYFRNRSQGEDNPGTPWGTWYYDNWRFWGVRANAGNGPIVEMSVAENDLLAAEGYLRTSRIPQAAALIDKTRVRAGLPSVAGITSATQPVPGTTQNCVPRVPQPPTYTTVACGNIFEALKWEKRNETSFTGYGQFFFDNRGWGDLPEGTVLEWPVPWQELYARLNLNLYSTTNSRAAKSNYGF